MRTKRGERVERNGRVYESELTDEERECVRDIEAVSKCACVKYVCEREILRAEERLGEGERARDREEVDRETRTET